MINKPTVSKKSFSADWFLQGALTRIGDTFDKLTGRRWTPSSSLATSELIERIKKLLDAEAIDVAGKGLVVPHNIKLKVQWDKFSTDTEGVLIKLENELLTAAADHINDSLYYTYAPLKLEVKPDYFTAGVKLFVSFDSFLDEDRQVEMNVTVPSINLNREMSDGAAEVRAFSGELFIARFEINNNRKDRRLEFPENGRLSVGRTSGNDLVVDDVSISKMHASLVIDSELQISVADTGSTNGTFINGQRISYGKATRLQAGDRVKFGVVDVIFEHVPRQAAVVDEAASSEMADDEAVEIGEFKFNTRVSTDRDSNSSADDLPDTTLKVTSPDGSLASPKSITDVSQ